MRAQAAAAAGLRARGGRRWKSESAVRGERGETPESGMGENEEHRGTGAPAAEIVRPSMMDRF